MADLPPDNPTFEDSLARLEEIVRALEDGGAGLEESLAHYEEGVGLLKRCYARLRQAEQRIVELTGVDEQGRPVLRPFEHTATADTEKAVSKRPRPV